MFLSFFFFFFLDRHLVPQWAGLGEDEEEEKGKQTQGREALCLGVLGSAGGLGGTKEKSCEALQVEGAGSTVMGNLVVPARAETAGQQQRGG